MTAPRARYAFNGDVAIAYGVVGDGPVDLVYVQGFVSHVELLWECPQAAAFFDRIAGWARLIVIDRRGTGMSDRFSAEDLPPLEDGARDILAVMDDAGSDKASLFGHHEGGQLAALLAALHPERVRTLSLMETAINWREAEGERASDADVEKTVLEWRRSFGTVAESQRLYEVMAPSHAGDRELFRFLDRLQRFAASPNSAVGFLRLLFETDIAGALSSITVPTQVLHRIDDQLLPADAGHALAAGIPGAELVELPGGDWWPFLGDTEPLLAALERFVLGTTPVLPGRKGRALATVLFTDIVDSTARSAAIGDAAWAALRQQHDDVVRQALADHGGTEVKTMGDGFLATFDGPARGVECAVRIVREVRALGIEIRTGLHTGEIARERGDISGIGVVIAARIASSAAPSELLVSQTVKDLVAGSGLAFEDAGEHELKGVPDKWRLYRVIA
ncbi:MAG TPA: adenylate/guanylate cyclase domain-containing protein [Actinomycetota bacterium]